jgi:hypothetical protein
LLSSFCWCFRQFCFVIFDVFYDGPMLVHLALYKLGITDNLFVGFFLVYFWLSCCVRGCVFLGLLYSSFPIVSSIYFGFSGAFQKGVIIQVFVLFYVAELFV